MLTAIGGIIIFLIIGYYLDKQKQDIKHLQEQIKFLEFHVYKRRFTVVDKLQESEGTTTED